MRNEIILFCSLVCIYSAVVLFYKFFGRTGLYMWTVIATISANIEVLILVDAFSMEQTLGNVLFASTFLVTDILSETEGKKYANKAVRMGIVVSVAFILISQSWFLYEPNGNDWAMPAIRSVFSNTPRLMLVSIAVYGIVQVFDVFAYHTIWKHTTKLFGDAKKGLWIRNNGSTLVSQLMNTVLFTFGAFAGVHSLPTLINICISSYVIYIVTSLLDTPAVYVARRLKNQNSINE
ncbi:queuosine precursor transporter [Emergencia timonensis]|uniref:queuosine precursor transporter n=1 Tax=Emergencia timonensis TaxID=1776384 RepID=UPI003994DC99